MKNIIKYTAFLLTIFLLSSCISTPNEDVIESQINVYGLFPAGNDQYTILASKTVEIENTWETDDTLLFIQIDTDGNLIDKKANSIMERPSVNNPQLLDNGNILFYGSLNQYYSEEYSAYEYTPSGQLNWELYLGHKSHGIAPANNDNLFVFGWESTPRVEGQTNYDDVTYTKMTTSGDTSWTKSLNPNTYSTRLSTGVLTSDNGCLAAGTKNISDRGTDLWVLHFNAQGDTLWSKTYGGDRYDYIHSINILSDNSILLVGSLSLQDTTNLDYRLSSGMQTYLVKLNSSGEKLWSKAIGRTLREGITAFIEGSDGSLIISGEVEQSYAYIFDVPLGWLSKLDANGNKIWRSEFELIIPIGIRELSNGDILAVTRNLDEDHYYNYQNNLNIIKVSSEGTLLMNETLTP